MHGQQNIKPLSVVVLSSTFFTAGVYLLIRFSPSVCYCLNEFSSRHLTAFIPASNLQLLQS
jgi:hypothetical protein